MDLHLKDKNIVITGAAGAIGRELAQRLLDEGANLVLHELDESSLESIAAEAQVAGRTVLTVGGDVRLPETQRAIAAAAAQLGGVDGFAPAAGIYVAHPFAEMTTEQWRTTVSINLDAVATLTSTLLPHIRDNASLVYFASIAGERGSRNHAHYAATKGAIVSFMRTIAIELGGRGIRANAVAPGIIESPMTNDLVAASDGELERATPLGRLGRPGEVADAVTYLLSQRSSFISGAQIDVNGGLYMAG